MSLRTAVSSLEKSLKGALSASLPITLSRMLFPSSFSLSILTEFICRSLSSRTALIAHLTSSLAVTATGTLDDTFFEQDRGPKHGATFRLCVVKQLLLLYAVNACVRSCSFVYMWKAAPCSIPAFLVRKPTPTTGVIIVQSETRIYRKQTSVSNPTFSCIYAYTVRNLKLHVLGTAEVKLSRYSALKWQRCVHAISRR